MNLRASFKKEKKKGKSAEKNRTRRRGEKRQKTSLFVGAFAFLKKQTNEEETKKKAHKSFFFTRKKKRTRAQKNHIMSADALKQKGNEAFKRNEFKLACEIFTEAIELDSTNHVLYSNRSAARVILIICVFFVHTVVYIFEAFFDRLHLFEKKITFSRQKRMKKWGCFRATTERFLLLLSRSFSPSLTIKIAFVFVLVRNNKTRTKDGLMR